MARVFIDLPAGQQPTSDPPHNAQEHNGVFAGFVRHFIAAGADRLSPDCIADGANAQKHKPVAGRFVLVGGPGQGKTTVSQFVCQLHRAALLSEKPRLSLAPEARGALELILAQCRKDGTPFPTCKRFPFRITLNHLARELSLPSGPKSILSYILNRIRVRTDQDIDASDLRQWLSSFPWVLIFDGLDEVPPASNRDEVLQAIQEFWVDATQMQADILVLATTRPQGYENDFSPQFYTHRFLEPLSPLRAMHYARRLAAARYGSDRDREQRIVDRLQRAAAEHSTGRLMRSPLQITIMATLVDQAGQPPRERWRLFREYYEVIYRREMERDIPAALILREHKANIDYIHHQVGLILQIDSEKVGQTDARMTAAAFGTVVQARLKDEGYETRKLNLLMRQIIDAATHRLVFLVGMQANQVGFEIRSLQEFMAAEALTEGQDDDVAARLTAIASLYHWENVFLFGAGKCFAARQHLREAVLATCVTFNEGEADDLGARILLGSQLALELLIDGTAHQQPKFERGLARLALKLSDQCSYNIPKLAYAYQSSLEAVYREELGRRLAGSLALGKVGAWTVTLCLIEAGVKWPLTLASNLWPPDLAEQRQILRVFIDATVGPEQRIRSPWLGSKIAEISGQMELVASRNAGLLWLEIPVGAPEWFRAVPRIFVQRFHASDAIKVNYYGLVLAVISVQSRVAEKLWQSAVGMPSGGEWDILKQVGAFALSPDTKRLGEALNGLARIWTPELGKIVADAAPWPLAECILSSNSREELAAAARRAREGQFGDYECWQKIERRWARGITSTDLTASDARGALPGPYLNDSGFAFLSAHVVDFREHTDVGVMAQAIAELMPLHKTLRTAPLRSAAADLLITLIRVKYPHATGVGVSCVDLADVVADCEQTPLPAEIVIALAKSGSSEAIDFSSLDRIGRVARIFRSRTNAGPEFIEAISRAWATTPTFKGLLAILDAFIDESEPYEFMRQPLVAYADSEPRYLSSALSFQLLHGRLGVTSARSIAERLSVIAQNGYPEAVIPALSVIRNKQVEGNVAAAMLVELYEKLPPYEWEIRNRVELALNDAVRRRQSGLGEKDVQEKLRLSIPRS